MNVWRGARRSILSRSLRTKTSTVRSRWPSRLPQSFWSSSSRLTTRPRSSASAYRRRNSVGVEPGALAVDVGLDLGGVDSELLDLDRLAAVFLLASGAAARGGGDSGDELLHGERLDEIVVGADLEGMDTVVLRASCADHDDRRSDAFRSRLLDEAPAVHTGQHQVDDTDLGVLESQARQARLPVAH